MPSENKTINYWIDLSEYDLNVAESLLEKGHYLYMGFMCHQSVEKMLKAIYVAK
jgi:HEPN domain-containing protein